MNKQPIIRPLGASSSISRVILYVKDVEIVGLFDLTFFGMERIVLAAPQFPAQETELDMSNSAHALFVSQRHDRVDSGSAHGRDQTRRYRDHQQNQCYR
jgi:hypothetical protein